MAIFKVKAKKKQVVEEKAPKAEPKKQAVSVERQIETAKGKTTSEDYATYIRRMIKQGHL